MKKDNVTGGTNRIIKLLVCGLIMTAMLVCFSGCRDRITNRDDADREAVDKTGSMAANYEKRRDQLDLKEAVDSLMKNKRKPRQEKKEMPEDQEAESKDVSGSNSGNNQSGNNGKGGSDSKEKGSGEGGSGEGEKGDPNGGNNNEPKVDPNDEKKKPKKVQVSFDPAGGTIVPANDDVRKYTSGKEYASFPKVQRDKYTFAGWYTEKEGGSLINENGIVPEEDHTLYAHWTKDSGDSSDKVYTLTFDPCDGKIKKREKTRQMAAGSPYGQMPLPVKTGNDFLGWFTQKDGGRKVSENDVYKEKGNQTLYAHWEYNPYKYWSSIRLEIYESMYACQVVDCYIEFEDNKTAVSCSLLSDVKIGNCARNRGSNTTVTDEWVEGRNPTAIIKCKGSSSQAASIKSTVAERFPGRRILVLPSTAVNGNDYEKLFYTLALGKAIYPSWFEEIDLDKVGSELGVQGAIYE